MAIARDTSAHAARSPLAVVDPSGHWRVVKRCAANGSRARHTRASPGGACTHSKPPVGWGGILIMMIIGLGLDATEIDRVADVIERHGDRFLRRIFTEAEVAYCTGRRVPAIHFAG